MTVDAVRAGHRVKEIELPLEPPGDRPHARRLPAPRAPAAGHPARRAIERDPDSVPADDPGDRPGDHRDHLHRLRRGRPPARARLQRVRAALPEAGLGRARRGRDLGGDPQGRDRGARRRGRAGIGPERDRHHQPARDGRRLGPRAAASRSTGRWSGRTAAPPARCDELRERRPRRRWCGSAPGWSSTPTSPAPRSSGCSGTPSCPRGRCSARSTPGSPSSSPAAT